MSMISAKVARSHNININEGSANKYQNVFDAQRNKIPILGEADFLATTNDVPSWIRVIISDTVGEDMLVSYQDLLKFRILHPNFPYHVYEPSQNLVCHSTFFLFF